MPFDERVLSDSGLRHLSLVAAASMKFARQLACQTMTVIRWLTFSSKFLVRSREACGGCTLMW